MKYSTRVLVCLLLSDNQFGDEEEIEVIRDLEETIKNGLDSSSSGEITDLIVGGGEVRMMIQGPSSESIISLLRQVIDFEEIPTGSFIQITEGEPEVVNTISF